MSAPTVSTQQVAAWNLQQLGLLAPFPDAVSAVQALVAVQAQSESSARKAIAVRTVTGDDPVPLLKTHGPLVRIWSVRGTLHIVPAEQAALHIWATRDEWFARWGRFLNKYLPVSRQQVSREISPRIAKVLSDQPMTHEEIVRVTGLPSPYDRLLPHLLKDLCYLGLCTRGTDLRGRATYLAPEAKPEPMPGIEAQTRLVHAYIAAYGPVTAQDIMYWSGFLSGTVKEALARLDGQLATVRMEGQAAEGYVTTEVLPRLLDFRPPVEIPDIRLPAFDVLLLAYKDKCRFLDEALRKQVFLSAARVLPVVLQTGRVSAVWNERTGEVRSLL